MQSNSTEDHIWSDLQRNDSNNLEYNSEGLSPSGSDKNSRNPLLSETEKCGVCGAAAAKHVHYGATTCFSCRAFFRRSIQNGAAKQYVCRKGNKCDIMVKTRKNCQKCRVDKCLDAGMKISWVLTEDERHKRFKKHREKLTKTKEYEEKDDIDFNTRVPPPSSTTQEICGIRQNFLSEHHRPQQQEQSMPINLVARQLPLHDNRVENAISTGSMRLHILPSKAAKINRSFIPTPIISSSNDGSMDSSQTRASGYSPPSSSQMMPMQPNHTSYVVNQGIIDFEPENVGIKNNIKFEDAYTSFELNSFSNVVMERLSEVSRDEIETISRLSQWQDKCYKSIDFGETLIKELLFSSVCGVPLSIKSSITAYRLMIQRINRVASGFGPFQSLNLKSQTVLLKHNADLVVSLRGAVFMEVNKQGLDQIVSSLGMNDCDFAKKLITDVKQQRSNRIEYNMVNSLQIIDQATPTERRYSKLLERVGTTVSSDVNMVTLLSYILLFSNDFSDSTLERNEITNCQETMIRMLQRYIFGKYPQNLAINLFAKVLNCVSDLQELCTIKKQRQMAVADPKKLMVVEQEKLSTGNP